MLCLPSLSFSENITFKYEGFIEDKSGVPVNQTVKMKFSIIDNYGKPVWTRERFVSIQEGKLSIILGKVFPLKKSFFNGDYYISTKIIDNKKDQLFIRPKLTLSQLVSNFQTSSANDTSNNYNEIIENTIHNNNQNIKDLNETEFAIPLSYNPNEVSFTIYDDGENVGIGTNNPKTKLHIKGEIQIESTNIDCNVNVEGSMRYNKHTKEMEYCNGSAWKSFCNKCNEDKDLLKGLVAYYPLDSDAKDHSVNKKHGELKNGVSFENGYANKALLCDGKDDYVQIKKSVAVESHNISVQAWVKSSNPGGNYKYIISKGAHTCSAASYALYSGSSGGLYFYIFNGYTAIFSNNAGKKIWDNNWHHIIGTYDGKTVRLFVDGKEVGQGVSTSTAGAGVKP